MFWQSVLLRPFSSFRSGMFCSDHSAPIEIKSKQPESAGPRRSVGPNREAGKAHPLSVPDY
jgi:hypothetical protein